MLTQKSFKDLKNVLVFYFNMEPRLEKIKCFTILAKLFSEIEHVGKYS